MLVFMLQYRNRTDIQINLFGRTNDLLIFYNILIATIIFILILTLDTGRIYNGKLLFKINLKSDKS